MLQLRAHQMEMLWVDTDFHRNSRRIGRAPQARTANQLEALRENSPWAVPRGSWLGVSGAIAQHIVQFDEIKRFARGLVGEGAGLAVAEPPRFSALITMVRNL